MSDALNIAVNGLNSTGSKIAKTASSIVNASSTGASGNLSSDLVDLISEKTGYAADAKVVNAVQRDNKTLIDILA